MKTRIVDNLQEEAEPLGHSEAEEIADLIRQNTWDVNQGEYCLPELERMNAFATPENIQREAARGYLVVLSTEEGETFGCALIIRRGMRLVIKTIQVKTGHRRKGYGSLLYEYCEQRFRQVGLKEIEVEVPKFPSSESFYRKHGFVKTGNPTPSGLYFAMFKYL